MNTIKKSASYIAFAFLGAVMALSLYSHFNSTENRAVVSEPKPVQLLVGMKKVFLLNNI